MVAFDFVVSNIDSGNWFFIRGDNGAVNAKVCTFRESRLESTALDVMVVDIDWKPSGCVVSSMHLTLTVFVDPCTSISLIVVAV